MGGHSRVWAVHEEGGTPSGRPWGQILFSMRQRGSAAEEGRGAAKESATEAAAKDFCCLKRQNWLPRVRGAGSPDVASSPQRQEFRPSW